jgi:hypothetical protein
MKAAPPPAERPVYVTSIMDARAVYAVLSAANLAHVVDIRADDRRTIIICPNARIASRVEGYLFPPQALF